MQNSSKAGELGMNRAAFHPADELLEGFTFGKLIVTVHTNEKTIDEKAVKRVFREYLERCITDAEESLDDNMKDVLKRIKWLRDKR